MRALLYWVVLHRWLLLGFLAGAVLMALPLPSDLTPDGRAALTIAVVSMMLFISEPVPLPTVALLIAVFQVLLGIAKPSDVAHSFMNDSVFFILGSLMLAVAIVKQRLDRRIAVLIFRVTGPKTSNIVTGLVVFCALLASLIGEHTVAAIMMPVVLGLLRHSAPEGRVNSKIAPLLLFSIAYACAIAGIGTPSGGARNAIMIEYWARLSHEQVSYFAWVRYAYPLVILQIPILVGILLWRFPPERRDLSTEVRRLRAQVVWEGSMGGRDWLTVSIFCLTLFLWVLFSGKIGLGTPALIGVSLYLAAGLVEWEDLNSGVNWGVVLIYASTISLGVAIEETGAAGWVARHFLDAVSTIGIRSGLPLLAAVSILTLTVSSFISRAPALGILTPVVLALARDSGTSSLAMGFVTAISSAFTYMTVIGSPPNTIIFSSGALQPRDYLRAGFWMTAASLLILMLYATTWWRFVLPV